MNNIFNTTRFFRLLKKHSQEQYKTYLLSLAVLAGVLFLIIGLATWADYGRLNIGAQSFFFLIFLLFSGIAFTSIIFSDLGDQRKAAIAMTLPVSNFEKFLIGWLYSYIVFLLFYTATFFAMVYLVIDIANSSSKIPNEVISITGSKFEFFKMYLTFSVFHGVALVSAVVFKKLHIIKTASVLFVFVFILILLNQKMLLSISDGKTLFEFPFSGLRIQEGKALFQIENNFLTYTIASCTAIGVSLLLWGAAFFKLKEKQL